MSGNATNKLARLDPSVPLARVEINRVGPEWLETTTRSDAADTALHVGVDPRDAPPQFEVMVPGAPLVEPPQPTAPPSEPELRDRLAEKLAEQHEAEQAMVTAIAAAERASDLLNERQRALYSFASLDQQITDHTVAALREHGRADLPDVLRERVTARDRAFADLRAAEAASTVLSGELTAARQHVEQRRQVATSAALAVLNAVVTGVATRHTQALADVETTYRELCEYDRFISVARGPLPIGVGMLLRNPPADHRGMIASPKLDVSKWRAALAELLADPMAEIAAG